MARFLRSAVFAVSASLVAGTARAEPVCYTDRGVEVCFPAGDMSFADELVSFEPGDPPTIEASDDPLKILGPPNYDIAQEHNRDIEQEYVTLGCGGTITFRFIEDDVSLLQGVTLGGTGKESGDRHPKVRRGALICAGATVLGNIEIGECAKAGAASVVLEDVPPRCTAVGVPARIVGSCCDEPARHMDQSLPDV